MPARIPFYTDGGLPFAYPPLPFYVEAALTDLLSLPKFVVANTLPPVIAALSLVSFCLFVQKLELGFKTQLVALTAYATIPIAFAEQIESAGLAEAFGSLALIWFAISLVSVRERNTFTSYIIAGLSWAVCVVTSPGSAYASALQFIIFVFAQSPRLAGQRPVIQTSGHFIAMAGVALVASSPYWLTVIAHHGLYLLMGSLGAQYGNIAERAKKILEVYSRFQVSKAPYPLLWNVTIFAGVAWAFSRRKWTLLAWFFVFYSVPREGLWLVSFPACILAGLGATEVFGPLLFDPRKSCLGRPARAVVSVLLAAYILLNPILSIRKFVLASYDSSDWANAISAMEWIRGNVPEESRLVVLSNARMREWSPHLARRTVLNVVQGTEWEPDKHRSIWRLTSAIALCPDMGCIQATVAEKTGYHDVYLYVDKNEFSDLLSAPPSGGVLFQVLWENSTVAVGHLYLP